MNVKKTLTDAGRTLGRWLHDNSFPAAVAFSRKLPGSGSEIEEKWKTLVYVLNDLEPEHERRLRSIVHELGLPEEIEVVKVS